MFGKALDRNNLSRRVICRSSLYVVLVIAVMFLRRFIFLDILFAVIFVRLLINQAAPLDGSARS